MNARTEGEQHCTIPRTKYISRPSFVFCVLFFKTKNENFETIEPLGDVQKCQWWFQARCEPGIALHLHFFGSPDLQNIPHLSD